MTDTGRIDWLEKNGHGFGLLNNDNGHWACTGEGTQDAPIGKGAADMQTTFFIEKTRWKSSIREAIDDVIAEVTQR